MKDSEYIFVYSDYAETVLLRWFSIPTTSLKRELSQSIQFEKIEMIKPEMNEQLIQELKNCTGLKIHRITIRKLDYLKDTAPSVFITMNNSSIYKAILFLF